MSVDAASAVNGIQSTIVSSDTTIRQTVQQQQTLFDTIQELATDNDTKNITSAASNNDTLEGKLNTVWDKMDSLIAEVNDLQAEITRLNSVIQTAQAEKEAAQAALESLNADLEQNQADLEAENEAKEANEEDLREENNALTNNSNALNDEIADKNDNVAALTAATQSKNTNENLLSAEQRAKLFNENELSNAIAEKESAQEALEAVQAEADRINASIREMQAEYDDIMAQINNITSKSEADEQARKNNLILQCMSEYNEESDGDYNEYLSNRLSEELGSSDCNLLISGLQAYSSGLLGECAGLNLSLTSTTGSISSYQSTIEGFDTTIGGLESRIEGNNANISTYNSNITSCNATIETYSSKISLNNTNIQNYTNAVSANNENIIAIEGRIAINNANIATFSSNITNINAKIADQNTIISNADDIIDYAQETIDANNARIDVIKNVEYPQTATEIQTIILSQVDAAELAVINSKGIDVTEKNKDGSNKWVIAQGKSDGKYHVYNAQNGASAVRSYAKGGGYDIIKSGNGYMSSKKQSSEAAGGNKVYYLDSVQYGDGLSGVRCDWLSYTTSSPLTFDLNNDGVQTSTSVIDFDIDGDGVVDKINDVNDAVLCFDKDGDGISGEDGSECFGNNTDFDGDGKADGFKDGFAALKFIAMNLGLINGKDDMVLDENDLATLEQEYGLKMKANGYNSEAQSLSALGISQINLANTDNTFSTDNFDGQGNTIMRQVGATFVQNGVEKEYADVWHEKKSFIA